MLEWVYVVWRCKACKWDNVIETPAGSWHSSPNDDKGKAKHIDCMNKATCGEKNKSNFLKKITEREAWDYYYPNGDNPFPWDEWQVLEAAVAEWKAEFADWVWSKDNPYPWYPAHKLNEYRRTKNDGTTT